MNSPYVKGITNNERDFYLIQDRPGNFHLTIDFGNDYYVYDFLSGITNENELKSHIHRIEEENVPKQIKPNNTEVGSGDTN